MKKGRRMARFDYRPRRLDGSGTARSRRWRRMLLAGGALICTGGLVAALAGGSSAPPRTATAAVAAPDGARVELALDLPPADTSSMTGASLAPVSLERAVPATAGEGGLHHGASVPQAEAGEAARAPHETAAPDVAPAGPETGVTNAEADEQPLESAPSPSQPGTWKELTVESGDNLAALFRRAGLTPRDVYKVVSADEQAKALTRLYPGDGLRLRLADEGVLEEVRYELSESKTLAVERDEDGGYHSQVIEHPLERRLASARGVIEHSLFVAGARAGLDDNLIMELAGIFGWDVDFALDIRRGDSFAVVYEELYRDGRKVRNGDIVAAEFVSQGQRFRAVRYRDPNGGTAYYAPDGRSMRKAFLRTPVNFAYVSSNFNPNRLHPILGRKRPHMGTDYAAKVGTPIKAAGDGRIIHLGRKGGYGRCIIIKHGARYTTLYGHMSRYRKGLHRGDRVRQGEVIGYVGQSGLATGPHLHYEFRIDGVHRNPRTVKLPEADPIPRQLLADFKAKAEPRLARLDSLTDTRVATAGEQ